MKRFLCPSKDLAPGRGAALDAGESAHAVRVLRLSAGDAVRLFDGAGREFEAVVIEAAPSRVVCRVGAPVEPPGREMHTEVTLVFGLPRRGAAELVIQKAVELGASRLLPVLVERSVARRGDRPQVRLDRWHAIVRDATKQCGRARLCHIESPAPWGEVVAGTPAGAGRIVCWEEERQATPLSRLATELLPSSPGGLWVAVGPEGGFTAAEVAVALSAGWRLASLGPRILRAETAALAALTAIAVAMGEM